MSKPVKFGITMSREHTFSNGINQNAIFMYLLFRHMGFECDILSYDEAQTQIVFQDIPVKRISCDPKRFNVAEYSALISVTTVIEGPIYQRCREAGVPVIGYVCTNGLCMAIERTATDRASDIAIGKDIPIDKAWIFDGFPFMKTYIELLRNVKAQYVPHLWNSAIVEYYCRHINKKDPALLVYNPAHHTQKKITILITEPNINFVKTAVLPLMAAEKLHALNPDLIHEVFVFSFPTDSKTLNTIISNISVGKKVRKFSRLTIAEIFLHFNTNDTVPIIVSNQIYTPLNYSYYETMYYGYPFVHNSQTLKEYGNYYPELDIDTCAVQILKAFQTHATEFEARLAKNRAYLESIDPAHHSCWERWRPMIADISKSK